MSDGTPTRRSTVDSDDRDPGGDDADDTYVHQPRSSPPSRAPTGDGEFGWRGWVLVGFLIFAFFIIPGAILFLPSAQSLISRLGLTLRDAYLVLPLVPAFVLAGVAVWAAVRARSS